ncbi:hypothetical protein PLICRDRAFT_39686 [Plicaturopsis crispa FD-325 SS-3]|nr:hypothetical protein PLICRDRAFT_39686 [Plicaturopsis crispa FD-325 SS-3]
MATLRPPSSPSPQPNDNGKHANSRASMGPSRGSQGLSPASPRPGGGSNGNRPTSELLGGAGMFQTPEAEAIDQWFENLQNYEATLEEMAAASLDVNFKEELSAIEQWFKVLSEAERTAALYSLLQHSTQVQIRFFITVLQQMARSDPMTALLSPAMGGSMQTQMEAKLASMNLKSPGLKSPMPSSPSARNFSAPSNPNRQSLALDTNTPNFLSPESAHAASPGGDAAATLAQQRAKLKAANSAHRISAPVLSTGGVGNNGWGPNSQLGQVAEQNNSPAQEVTVNPLPTNGSRPKSTEFSGTLGSPRPGGGVGESTLSPMPGDSWASMVNTPLIPMFQKDTRNPPQNLDAAASKLNDWSGSRVPLMEDPKKFRRVSKGNTQESGQNGGVYDNDGNLVSGGQQQHSAGQQQQRNGPGGMRNANGGGNFNGGGWNGVRSPALSNTSSNRFGGDDGGAGMNGLGMGGFNMGLGSPGLGMGIPGGGLNMASLAGMGQINPYLLNMANAMGMGMSPDAQILAAQMAAGGFNQPGWMGMQGQQGMGSNRSQRGPGRSPGGKPPSSNGRGGNDGAKKDEDEVDPQLLNDIPAWLRSLRLHKYTPNFEGMKWQDMVALDEAALEAKGVAALGARRKMLKTFETVRLKMGIPAPESST